MVDFYYMVIKLLFPSLPINTQYILVKMPYIILQPLKSIEE